MSLFKKKDEHAGSGLDKPDPKGLVEKVVDKMKGGRRPARRPAQGARRAVTCLRLAAGGFICCP